MPVQPVSESWPCLQSTPGRKIDRAHRRLLEGRSGRFSPEATGTNLIYSFPHPRGESGCSRNCSRPQQKNECGGTSLLVRLSWSTFSPAPKIFLWKSRDRAERSTHARHRKRKATDVFRAEVDFEQVLYRLALHAQSRQQHCLHRARRVRRARSRMWLKGARSLSNMALTSGRQPSAPGAENVLQEHRR